MFNCFSRGTSAKPSLFLSLVSVLAVAGYAASFTSCDQRTTKKPETRFEFPDAPPPNVDPASGSSVSFDTAPLGLDGTWKFDSFDCLEGAITPWAKLENDLVGEKGLPTPSFKWPTQQNSNSWDQGVIRRSHLWTIQGNSAIRISKLEYFSLQQPTSIDAAARGYQPTASASRKKTYTLNRTTEGRLILGHGKLEAPVFSGLPLDPVNAVINKRIDDLVKAGGVSATLIKPIQDLKTFISRGINANWVKSALSFFEDVTQATEALDYELDQRNLSLSNSAISVRGMSIINPEKDLRLVDITACGMNGKATRHYERMD